MTQLEHAFKIGCTDEQACLYAGISHNQLEYYIKEINPEFRAKKELLKEMNIIHARQTVSDSLKQDPGTAFRYLERKQKDEFAPQSALDGLFDPGIDSVQINIVRTTQNETEAGNQRNDSAGEKPPGSETPSN